MYSYGIISTRAHLGFTNVIIIILLEG